MLDNKEHRLDVRMETNRTDRSGLKHRVRRAYGGGK
jgi:hypothetical protein